MLCAHKPKIPPPDFSEIKNSHLILKFQAKKKTHLSRNRAVRSAINGIDLPFLRARIAILRRLRLGAGAIARFMFGFRARL